ALRIGVWLRVAFGQVPVSVDRKVLPALDLPRRPADCQARNRSRTRKSENHARVAAGEVTAAALDRADQGPAAGLQLQPRPDSGARTAARSGRPVRPTPSQWWPLARVLRSSTTGAFWWLMTTSVRPSLSRSPRARPRAMCLRWKYGPPSSLTLRKTAAAGESP